MLKPRVRLRGLVKGWPFSLAFSAFNPMLMFIALFVWLGAAGEMAMVETRFALKGIPIHQAMITNFRTLSPDDTLAIAAENILAGLQQDFPVVEDGQLVGLLPRADLMLALAKNGPHTLVGKIMRRRFQTADLSETLDRVFSRFQSNEGVSMPVVRDKKLVGIITPENVSELLMVKAALQGSPS